MAVKAINDTVRPNELIPMFLMFGAYPRIITELLPLPFITQRAYVVQKAIKELHKLNTCHQINKALQERNGPLMEKVLALPLQSEVLVWREKQGWQGLYKVINT